MRAGTESLKRRPSQFGFTLIEVMLVLAVISILALVTVPKYQALIEQIHLDSSAQSVVGRLNYAKQLAMDQRKTIYVAFNGNAIQILDSTYQSIGDSQSFESGVSFNQLQSLGLNPLTDGTNSYGWGLAYSNKGYVMASGGRTGFAANILLTSSRSGRSESINIGAGTGYLTTSEP
ncbi:pilus assembly FimT family protein [Desulfosporosinus metallidurans]|uniref:Type IV pilin PilA n=1 Tax=Desulfosporosinus metallidurans TaxID=1888891 RepID=A0A1Q8QY28_9FIRM|nr:prepilin-type N-terminal cleavage/methylation domain-containing protein [Desulfosporosinus metallidurans]OLN32237.1 Type IV pilin PilA [Desulfosporosinus metallidurans]